MVLVDSQGNMFKSGDDLLAKIESSKPVRPPGVAPFVNLADALGNVIEAQTLSYAGGVPKGKGRSLRPGPIVQVGLTAYAVRCVSLLSPLIAACAAARRAMGTRNGEQDT